MSSTAVPKSRYLQSLSNIDLAHRNKKVITTPTRPPAPPASRVSKDASVVVPKSKPVIAECSTVQPVRVRRIYDRDFLLKFKYSFTDFPPGVPTPAELVEQYNRDLEIRESRERQAMLESSSLSAKSNYKPAVAEKSSAPISNVGRASSTTSADKENIKEKKVAGTGLKLRIPSAKHISRLPMFSSKAEAAQSPVHHVATALDNKENREHSAWSNPNAPAVFAVKKQVTVPAFLTTLQPVSSVISDSIKKTTTPAPAVVVEAKAAPVYVIIPEAPLPEKSIEDSLEDLSKKLRTVLREEDPRRLAQRQKQIEYGKNTLGYANYTTSVAKNKRKREDPKTPNKHQICSKRSWDGQIRKWRRQLHFYDPQGVEYNEDSEMTADDTHDDVDVKVPEIDTPVPLAIEASVC